MNRIMHRLDAAPPQESAPAASPTLTPAEAEDAEIPEGSDGSATIAGAMSLRGIFNEKATKLVCHGARSIEIERQTEQRCDQQRCSTATAYRPHRVPVRLECTWIQIVQRDGNACPDAGRRDLIASVPRNQDDAARLPDRYHLQRKLKGMRTACGHYTGFRAVTFKKERVEELPGVLSAGKHLQRKTCQRKCRHRRPRGELAVDHRNQGRYGESSGPTLRESVSGIRLQPARASRYPDESALGGAL